MSLIIEKKSDIIDPSRIVIPENYCLIKPDPNYTEYQYKGRETGILSSDFIYDNQGKRVKVASRNYSVTGTVFAIPNKLRYDIHKARKIEPERAMVTVDGEEKIIDPSLTRQLSEMYRKSVDYETDIEVQVGDRVRFSYMAHEKVKENLGMIETSEGLMYFVRYDDLWMVIDEDLTPVKGLNGFILVRPDVEETESVDGAEGVDSNGIFVVKLGSKEKRKRKKMTGVILSSSTPVRSYKNAPNKSDDDSMYEKGDKVFFDPRGGTRLEMMNHQEYSEDDLMLIRRSDIYLSSRQSEGYDKIDFMI